MYVTPNHICFNSSFLGYVVVEVIPINTIDEITPSKSLLSRAITLTLKNGQKVCFCRHRASRLLR
jgi:hypothetical protein